jgi:alcohol dehydrogenase
MRAVLIESFGEPPVVVDVPEPPVPDDGALVRVEATGLCRSDWHGWQGHDDGITLPHVPGHEFAGVIAATGREVGGWKEGDRVTAPFVCACGRCEQCLAGNHQVCLDQQQPGFTYWGSFAELVAIPHAETNLVRLPDRLDFDASASLGCRFATAYRAVKVVAAVEAGQWLAVFGCGGAGLSAVMIGAAFGAAVVAIDTDPEALALAGRHGAAKALRWKPDTADEIRDVTGGGAHVTVDAIGAVDAVGAGDVVRSALQSLRPRGRHVQIGLLPHDITLNMSALIGRELQWLGSHGMSASDYPPLLEMVSAGTLRPDLLVTKTIPLDDAPAALADLSRASSKGITVIHPDKDRRG